MGVEIRFSKGHDIEYYLRKLQRELERLSREAGHSACAEPLAASGTALGWATTWVQVNRTVTGLVRAGDLGIHDGNGPSTRTPSGRFTAGSSTR